MTGISIRISAAFLWAVFALSFSAAISFSSSCARADNLDSHTSANPAILDTLKETKAKSETGLLTLVQGTAEVIDIPGPVSDVMIANPSIADVTAIQSNRIYVVGRAYGSTNLIALDDKGNIIKRLNIHVKIDDVLLQRTLNELFPGEDVHVRALQDQMVVWGRVSSPMVASNITNIVTQYTGELQDAEGAPDELIVNLLKVSGEQQVMLKVKVVEVSRSVLRELGIETNLTGVGKGMTTGTLAATASRGLTADPLGVASVLYNNGANPLGPINVIVRALEEEGLVNTLAEPNLTAISGEQAGFLAGGEVPVPSGRDTNGNITVEYHPFGVALNFLPRVLSNERISLQIQTEVSSVSNTQTVQGQELTYYSFDVRRAATTVELGSGGSLMIAGLLQSDVRKTMDRLPGAASLPIIGDLLSSKSFQRQESELVVIVTAYMVEPYADSTMVKEEPVQEGNPLAEAFSHNIMKAYSKLKIDTSLFGADNRYGYLIQ